MPSPFHGERYQTQNIGQGGLRPLSGDLNNDANAKMLNRLYAALLMSCLSHDIRNGFMTLTTQADKVFQWFITKVKVASVVHLLCGMLKPYLTAVLITLQHRVTLCFPCSRAQISQIGNVHVPLSVGLDSSLIYRSSAQTISAFNERRWVRDNVRIDAMISSGRTMVMGFLGSCVSMIELYNNYTTNAMLISGIN
jgi:hypothetical protein